MYYAKTSQVVWVVNKANVPRWRRVQMDVSVSTELIYIVGTVGRDRGHTGNSYIAIDDISIASKACVDPGMSTV